MNHQKNQNRDSHQGMKDQDAADCRYHTIPYHGCATVDATMASGYAWL